MRRVLVRWKGFIEPTWEDRANLEENEALDIFENKFGRGHAVGEDEGAQQGLHTPKERRRSGQM